MPMISDKNEITLKPQSGFQYPKYDDETIRPKFEMQGYFSQVDDEEKGREEHTGKSTEKKEGMPQNLNTTWTEHHRFLQHQKIVSVPFCVDIPLWVSKQV